MNDKELKRIVNSVIKNMSKSFKELYREDFYQEARIVLWLKKDAYNEDLGVSKENYHYKLIRWACLDYITKLLPMHQGTREGIHVSIDSIELEIEHVDTEYLMIETKEFIEKALNSLKESDKHLLYSYYIADKTMKELTKQFNCDYQTLANKRERALQRMKELT